MELLTMSNIIRQARANAEFFPMPTASSNDVPLGHTNPVAGIERQAERAQIAMARYMARMARVSGQQSGGNGPTREPLWRPPTVWGQIP